MRKLGLLLKIVISVTLLLWVLGCVEAGQLFQLLHRVSWSSIICVLALEWFGYLCDTLKQYLVLRHSGNRCGFGRLLSLRFMGAFACNFLPSSVGGDVVRAVGLGVQEKNHAVAWASVVFSRCMGVISVAILVALAGSAGSPFFPGAYLEVSYLCLFIALAAAALLAASCRPFIGGISELSGREGASRLRVPLQALADMLRQTASYHKPSLWVASLLLSMLTQLAGVVAIYLLGHGLDPLVPFNFYLVVVPLVALFSMLPLSLNGLGLQDMGYLFFFQRHGFPAEIAVLVSLLWHLLRTAATLPGLALIWSSPFATRQRKALEG